jgi:hypothetical protein
MTLPNYLVFGEALTDFILQDDGRWQDYPGGSCWNVARVAARLGAHAAFAGAVSQDRFGDALWQGAETAGLDMRYTQQLPYPPLLAMVPSTRPPQYFSLATTVPTCTSTPPTCLQPGSSRCALPTLAASAWRANHWPVAW